MTPKSADEVPAYVTELMRKACHRKSQHVTKAAALRAFQRLVQRGRYDGLPMSVYRCPAYKTHWHFGHTPYERCKAKGATA